MAKKLRDDYVIYLEDPNWKTSSMNYNANCLRDIDENIVTVFLKKSFTIQETSHKLPFKTCQELVEITVTFEDSLHILRNGRDEQDRHVSHGADDSEES